MAPPEQLTLLDVGLLRLVGENLVQLLLIGITEVGDIELCLGIHGVGICGKSMENWKVEWDSSKAKL